MFIKLVLIFLAAVIGSAMPVAQAATRTNALLEMVKVEAAVPARKCLEAFVDSRFSYAYPLCLSLAQRGVPDAQLVTGLMYALGEGTRKNPELARLWLKEALRNGSGEAKEALIEFKLID